GRPIAQAELEAMAARLPDERAAQLEVDEARGRAIAELVVRPPQLDLDLEDLSLAAAVHDALFLVHPEADAWWFTQGDRRRVLDTARALAEVPLARDRDRLLGRHGLLHGLGALTRRDVKL